MTEPRMTNADAVVLCRLAKAACPQQQFDQYTPDMWHELLGDLRFEDARQALVEVVKSQPFVSPAEIRAQVRKVRDRRLLEYGPIIPPSDLDNGAQVEIAWIREMTRMVADGEIMPGQQPPMAEVLARVMPDWEAMLPRVPTPTRGELTAATKKAKPANYASQLAAARAELAARRPIPTPEDAALATAEPEDAS